MKTLELIWDSSEETMELRADGIYIGSFNRDEYEILTVEQVVEKIAAAMDVTLFRDER